MAKTLTDGELLQALIEQGVITEADIREVAGPQPARLKLISLTHTLFCPATHAARYYQEEMQSKYWNLPEHMRWEAVAIKILQHFEISNDNEALEMFDKAISAAKLANEKSLTIARYILDPQALLDILDIDVGLAAVESSPEQGLLPYI